MKIVGRIFNQSLPKGSQWMHFEGEIVPTKRKRKTKSKKSV